MVKRTLAAIPALAFLFSVVYFLGLYAKIVVALVAILCIHEMMRATEAKDARPIRAFGYAYAVLLYPAYEFVDGYIGIVALITLAVISIFVMLVLTSRDAKDGLMTVFPMIYPGLFFAALIAIVCIPEKNVSQFLLIIAFGAAVITDTFAYFCGRLFGKHKLVPKISPKKTVEGAIGGTIFGTGAVFLIGYFAQTLFDISVRPYWYLIFGLILAVLTQFGDLSASIIKRKFGIKDYGKIMGEHGGAMDRMDSVLFISPIVFAFYYIIVL